MKPFLQIKQDLSDWLRHNSNELPSLDTLYPHSSGTIEIIEKDLYIDYDYSFFFEHYRRVGGSDEYGNQEVLEGRTATEVEINITDIYNDALEHLWPGEKQKAELEKMISNAIINKV